MSQSRIYIAVAAHNRRAIAELCLPTLRAAVGNEDFFVCYNDGSTEYDAKWLRQWADRAIQLDVAIGIEAQRRQHLLDFWSSDCQLLYFSDHDCLHDVTALNQAVRLQEKYGNRLTGLYDTLAHSSLPGNTLEDNPDSEVIWRRYAPGVSYLLTREHVSRILPKLHSLTAFDWQIPDILGNRCAVSRVGYLDHIGWGGQRHPSDAGFDEGDRVKSPTSWLIAKRAEVVARLKQDATP